ncbi:MAG TPA: hypothetical protein VII50_09935 [Acidothermaceae bacterium]
MQSVVESAGRSQLRSVPELGSVVEVQILDMTGEPLPEPVAPAPASNHDTTTPVLVPPMPPPVGAPGGLYIAPMGMGLGTRIQIEAELDGMAADIRLFWAYEPDLVLRKCSAYTARLTELYVALNRAESADRQYTRVRTQQVAIWLEELDRQFKSASRLIEVNRQDVSMLRGHEG